MNSEVVFAAPELLSRFSRHLLTAEELRTQLLAAANADPAGAPQLSAAVREALQVGQLPANFAEALLTELAAISAYAPTLQRVVASAAAVKNSGSDSIDASTKIRAMPEHRSATLDTTNPVGFEPGTVIKSRFVLQEQIGRGGMGIVFAAIDRRKTEARDPNPLVALKILNAELARHPTALIALQREARKAQSLAHPNVATVFDFDRDGDTVFLTMELLRGRSLDVVLREGNGRGMPRDAALRIVRSLAAGLAYAHRKGIVHSDLKPGNVFLLEDGEAKILDFGIARAVPGTQTAEPKDMFDASALCAYTEAYATIEMAAGADPHPADDVYALGLIAYELLAGTHPYRQYGALRARKLGLKPAPLKSLRRHEWRTLERSLAFERGMRPRDAAEFVKQLTGVTQVRRVLITAILTLALFSAYSWYRNYMDAAPVVPFEQLSVDTQRQFKLYMADGDKLWQFYAQEQNILALQEAIEQYANAYELHPRNRQAVRALEKVADEALAISAKNPQQQREFARVLAGRSEYLAKYPPVAAINK